MKWFLWFSVERRSRLQNGFIFFIFIKYQTSFTTTASGRKCFYFLQWINGSILKVFHDKLTWHKIMHSSLIHYSLSFISQGLYDCYLFITNSLWWLIYLSWKYYLCFSFLMELSVNLWWSLVFDFFYLVKDVLVSCWFYYLFLLFSFSFHYFYYLCLASIFISYFLFLISR